MTTTLSGTNSSLANTNANANANLNPSYSSKEGVSYTAKDAYGGTSSFNKSLEGQPLVLNKQTTTFAQQQQPLLPFNNAGGSRYSGNIQYGAIPNTVASNYSVQRFEAQQQQGQAQGLGMGKVLWSAESGPIQLQHKEICLAQEPLMIKPEPIVVQQPPVVFQPDIIQIPQPPLVFQPEAIAIPIPPISIQPEPVIIERPPLVIQPETVVLRRPDVMMAPSFQVQIKYGQCSEHGSAQCLQCPPGTVPASSLAGQQQFGTSAASSSSSFAAQQPLVQQSSSSSLGSSSSMGSRKL